MRMGNELFKKIFTSQNLPYESVKSINLRNNLIT